MSEPQWTWVFQDEQGAVVAAVVSPVFSARFDAESWLGANWRSIAAQAVAAATLEHQGERVGAAVTLSE